VRTKAPDDGKSYSFQGGTVPLATQIEGSRTVYGQRDTVCRKKDEYGDTVDLDDTGKVAVDELFAPLMLLAFAAVLLLVFCIRPILRSFRTMLCGAPKSLVEENRLFVQSRAPTPVEEEYLPGDARRASQMQRLGSPSRASRQTGQVADAPAPLDALPDAPASPPHQLLPPGTPESATPISQALSPLVLPPTPGPGGVVAQWPPTPAPPSDEELVRDDDGVSQGSKKKWSRPVGKKKQAWMTKEEKPPSPTSEAICDDKKIVKGPNVAPASVANNANLGFGMGLGGM